MAALSRPRRLFVTLALACLASPLQATLSAAAMAAPTENQLKAALLFSLAQFVEWPSSAFASPHAPFVIAVVARDEIAGELEGLAGGESIAGHPLQVQRFRELSEVQPAHMVFALDPTATAGATLTVSDAEGAAERGAMVQLARVQNRIPPARQRRCGAQRRAHAELRIAASGRDRGGNRTMSARADMRPIREQLTRMLMLASVLTALVVLAGVSVFEFVVIDRRCASGSTRSPR